MMIHEPTMYVVHSNWHGHHIQKGTLSRRWRCTRSILGLHQWPVLYGSSILPGKLDKKGYWNVRGSVLATAALTLGITFGNFHFGMNVSDLLRMDCTPYHTTCTIQVVSYILYHTRLHKIVHPWQSLTSLCVSLWRCASTSILILCTLYSYTMYPNVVTALQHTSYTFVDPLGFWNLSQVGGHNWSSRMKELSKSQDPEIMRTLPLAGRHP